MSTFDLFNGDADGILARHQYRFAHPNGAAQLISGVKRDVKLVKQLSGQGAESVFVFDISLESNASEVRQHIDAGVHFTWFDHHRRGDLQDGPLLQTTIDLSPTCCTSLLVDHAIGGIARPWAIAAAYGDNLREVATALGLSSGCSEQQCDQLKALGETLNYNGYGEQLSDLAATPLDVARDLEGYDDPFDYMKTSPVYERIALQKTEDEEAMGEVESLYLSTSGEVLLLPRGGASRRMSGLFSNEKVNEEPDLAHAIVTHLEDEEGYRISIRAPKARPEKADVLATKFKTGGGRAAAGGINHLPLGELDDFFNAFDEVFAC